MNLEARKISLIDNFMKIQNDEIITQIETIIAKFKSKSNNDFEPMTKDELNRRIDKAENDSINERLTETSDLKNEMKEWF